jgi:hypothetical protein
MSMSIRLVALVLLLTSAGFAQGFWQKKAPGEWSPKECEKVLTDSPWAKSRTIGDVMIEEIGKPESVDGREGHPWVAYTARFWSALPVRQALVRQLQLTKDFVSMSPERKRCVVE